MVHPTTRARHPTFAAARAASPAARRPLRIAPRPVWLLLIALPTMLAVAVPASAGYAFGTFVDRPDYDYTPTPKAVAAQLCFVDDDSDATHDPDETVYLAKGRTACDRVKGGDLRLTGRDVLKPGTDVKDSDATDWGAPLAGPLPHAVRWCDLDGDTKLGTKDAVVLDLRNLAVPRVDVGDVLLTKLLDGRPGTVVADGSMALNLPLADLKGGGTAISDPFVIYEAGKAVYLNTDKDEPGVKDFVVEDKDVRLNDQAVNPFEASAPSATPSSGTVAPGAPVAVAATAPSPLTDVVAVEVPASVIAGAPFQAKVTVRNAGPTAGPLWVETRLGGTVVDSRGTGILAANATQSVVLTLVAPSASIDVASGTKTARLTVIPAVAGGDALALSAADPSKPSSTAAIGDRKTASTPSLSGVLLVAAIGLALLVARGPAAPRGAPGKPPRRQ